MDPIYPWLDPNEVRRLADHLLKPNHAPVLTVADVGFDKGFVGYEASQSAEPSAPPTLPPQADAAPPTDPPQVRVTPPPAPPQARVDLPSSSSEDQAVPAQSPPSSPPPLTPAIPAAQENPTIPVGSFLDRVTRFRDWMREHFAASDIFILDREGAVIFDDSHHGRLHFLARSLALAPRRAGTSASNVHVKIGATTILEVIPVDTAGVRLVLGAVVPNALDAQAVTAITTALVKVGSQDVEG